MRHYVTALLKLWFAIDLSWSLWRVFTDLLTHDWHHTWMEYIYGQTYGYGECAHIPVKPGYHIRGQKHFVAFITGCFGREFKS